MSLEEEKKEYIYQKLKEADKSSREYFEEKKKELDPFYDKVYLKYFIRQVQKISPDIGAIYFPETYQLIFFYKNVIIYKIILNKNNIEDISVERHLKNIRNIYLMLKNNLIVVDKIPQLKNIKQNFNKRKTGKILN